MADLDEEPFDLDAEILRDLQLLVIRNLGINLSLLCIADPQKCFTRFSGLKHIVGTSLVGTTCCKAERTFSHWYNYAEFHWVTFLKHLSLAN